MENEPLQLGYSEMMFQTLQRMVLSVFCNKTYLVAQICSNHIYFIFIGILIHENLGLDTKITFLLQLEQKLWNIYRNTVWNWRPSWIFLENQLGQEFDSCHIAFKLEFESTFQAV